ncbi:MAG: signal peptidase I [Candidatus Saccharimonadales bacterium]
MDNNELNYQTETDAAKTSETKHNLAFIKIVISWIVAITIAIGLQQFVFQSYQVFGASMEPTLSQGDYLIISKLGPSLSELRGNEYLPERGSIVVVNGNNNRLIKRVIGLPNDNINISEGKVTIYNNSNPTGFDPYEELDLPTVDISGELNVVVPEGEIFLIGDNRENGHSLDSRNQLGSVKAEDIIGSLTLKLWPVSDMQAF